MPFDKFFNPDKNSFTALRLFLASFVVLSHSYILGGYGLDPLVPFQVGFGEIAVEGFFVISGFLVTRSYMRDFSFRRYIGKRFLRIFPGYWVCLFVTGLIISPVIYFLYYGNLGNSGFWKSPFIGYVSANFLLWIKQMGIKGLFAGNPCREIVNGALWTLLPEFIFYLVIPALGVFLMLEKRKKLLLFLFCFLLIFNAAEGIKLGYFRSLPVYDTVRMFFELQKMFSYFLAGVLFFLYHRRILFNTAVLLCAIVIFILCINLKIYNLIGPVILSYVIMGLSVKLPFGNFDKYGDFSYGLYIYSFPTAQVLYFLNPGIKSHIVFFLCTLIITLFLAYLSWHFVENPCLRLKKRL